MNHPSLEAGLPEVAGLLEGDLRSHRENSLLSSLRFFVCVSSCSNVNSKPLQSIVCVGRGMSQVWFGSSRWPPSRELRKNFRKRIGMSVLLTQILWMRILLIRIEYVGFLCRFRWGVLMRGLVTQRLDASFDAGFLAGIEAGFML